MRLVLGTAQLGMDYGVANASGKPAAESAKAIVERAWERGIREFDTASAYGESESVLGTAVANLGIAGKARIISKLPPDINCTNPQEVYAAAEQRLKALGVDTLHGLMLHREEHLSAWDQGLGKGLRDVLAAGIAGSLGVSVYSPTLALKALTIPEIGMIQIPSNLLDRRFEQAGVFDLAEKKGKTIYVRSVLLQGLLLMDPDQLPAPLAHAAPEIWRIRDIAQRFRVTPLELALGYAKKAYPQAMILFGAEQPTQVEKNTDAWATELPGQVVETIHSQFPDVAENIINPSLWER